eukprot:scaffold4223_cov189-Amphora_coffeaeformis.AAC.17
MSRIILVAMLASAVVDAFTPQSTTRNYNTHRRLTPNGGDEDEPTVEQPLWRSPLRGMGGDYSNMEGVDVEKPIPVGYAPPPKVTRRSIQDVGFGPAPSWGPQTTSGQQKKASSTTQPTEPESSSSSFKLKGLGGDYANMEGVSVATPLPVGYEYSVVANEEEDQSAAVEEPVQEEYMPPSPLRGYGGDADNVASASPAEKEIFIYRASQTEDDVAVGETYEPPTAPLQGVGGDVGNVQSAPPVEKPTSPVQQQESESSRTNKPLPVLKGLGGDYANSE